MKENILGLAFACVLVPALAGADNADGYASLSFTTLSSYKFEVPMVPMIDDPTVKRKPPKLKSKIPEEVKALSGKRFQIVGYMLPLEGGTDGAIKEFILMRNQITCCFGDANRVTEYIYVTMAKGRKAQPIQDAPVNVKGTLDVGPKFEDGMLREIYRMTADEVGK